MTTTTQVQNAGSTTSSVGGTATTTAGFTERLAQVWATLLNAKSEQIIQGANDISVGGNDKPGDIAMLTARTHELSFLSNGASTSINTAGQATEKLANKS